MALGAHDVHPAALAGSMLNPATVAFQPLVRIGDHRLDFIQAAQELSPEGLGVWGSDGHSKDFAAAKSLTPTAIISATETMRPA